MIRSMDEVQQITRGFWAARVILSAVELDLFTPVLERATPADEIARSLGTDPRATEILLDAVVCLGLMTKEEGRYMAAPLAARHLSPQAPDPRIGMLLHQSNIWDRWSLLTEVVRTGRPAPRTGSPERHGNLIRAMNDSKQGMALPDWLPFDLHGVRRAIDLGGGAGNLARALVEGLPDATVTLFDLAPTLEIARGFLPADLWGSRVIPQVGDLLADPGYGQGYDLAVLAAVLHMFSPDRCAEVVRKAAAALVPGGRLVVREFVLNEDRAGPPQAALFSINMLVSTEGGRSYSFAEIAGWMREGGIASVERHPVDRGDVIVGVRG